jgi:molybdopterin/thiamine biosynthesis adenylyltransferase
MTELSEEDRAIYEWQLDVPGFGEAGQKRLRNTTALVSRVGGLGGPVALQLAAAGIGKLILAHGGNLRPSDLNRQILMRREDIGKPRVDSAAATLRAFNPGVEIETVDSQINEENAPVLVDKSDIVFDCAPRFPERFLMNRECVAQGKPMIDAAMFSLEGQVVPIVPGETPCLACLFPEVPPHWKRRFPVIGAVSSLVGNVAVMEGIKLLTGVGVASLNQMVYIDTATMQFKKIAISRRADCAVCGVPDE